MRTATHHNARHVGFTTHRHQSGAPRLPRPPLGDVDDGVGSPSSAHPPQGDQPPRSALLRVRPGHLRGEGTPPRSRPQRVRHAATPRGPRGSLSEARRARRTALAGPRRGTGRGGHHRVPPARLLLPRTAPGVGFRRPTQPDARRLRRAARRVARHWLLLGRLLAFERPLPLRRRRHRRDDGRRRNGIDPRAAQRRATRRRPRADDHQRRRRNGRHRRLTGSGRRRRRPGTRRGHRRTLRGPLGGAHDGRVHRLRRAIPHHRADPTAQRARLRGRGPPTRADR